MTVANANNCWRGRATVLTELTIFKGVFVLKIWAAIALLALIAIGVAIAVIGLCVTVFVKRDRNG